MNEPQQNKVLLQVAGVLHSSLARYLHFAEPWHRNDDEEALEVIQQVVTDQEQMVDRITQYVQESDTPVELAGFPMQYTGLHDLSLCYLLKKLVEQQRQVIAGIAQCVEQLTTAPMAKALAEEALGLSKGHLALLEEIGEKPADAAA